MTDFPWRPVPRWLQVLTVLAVGNVATQLAVGTKPIIIILSLALLVGTASIHLCVNPKLIHPWAILAAVATLVLLAIGQLVTSFGAGMADRVWPTEPWYVFHTATDTEKARFKEEFAFFIEHTHRLAAWTVGGLVIVLAIGTLWTDPRKAPRWVALAGVIVLIAGYGEFHRGLMAQSKPDVAARDVQLPTKPMWTAIAGMVVMLGAAASGLFASVRGSGVRVLAGLALVAVMIQGLLGGFRVKLNELVGTDLAAFHGVFAQVVFGLLVSLAVLTAKLSANVSNSEGKRIQRWALILAHLIFVQVVFGALVRHFPVPLTQRLHFLTAFLATAVAVLVLRAVFADANARSRAGAFAWALAALIVLQIYLGVEAWMAKFGQYTLPELVKVTAESGAIRTLHALVGSGVWAMSLALAIRLRPVAVPVNTLEPIAPVWPGQTSHATALASEGAAHFRGDAQ
jgi:cytochrome c oxidase assembly protein subunit 15